MPYCPFHRKGTKIKLYKSGMIRRQPKYKPYYERQFYVCPKCKRHTVKPRGS